MSLPRRTLIATTVALAALALPFAAHTQGTGKQGFFGERLHLPEFIFGGQGLVISAALAHHVKTQRGMRQLGAHINGKFFAVERIEIFGETLP